MRTLVLMCLAAVLAGCATFTPVHPATAERGVAADPEASFHDDGWADGDLRRGPAPVADLPPLPTDPTRKVIYNADFTVRITNLEHARRQTRTIAADLGGYVQTEQDQMVALRVPATRFAAAVERIATLGRVTARSVTADDVTEQYVDLEIRLRVKQDYLEQLNRLYEKGGDLKDLLEVKREIDKVTEEIERIKGKLRFLADRVSLSTIVVRFQVTVTHIERSFKLPFSWLETLGIENLLTRNRGARP